MQRGGLQADRLSRLAPALGHVACRRSQTSSGREPYNMPLRVLVVEDDQMSLELIGQILASEEIEVLGLRDAWEAAALVEKEKFDGIFLDLTMPGIDGLELARRIRGSLHNGTTPIVVVTGRTERETMKDAFSAGAHFFLAKPLDSAKLRNLLNTTYGTLLSRFRNFAESKGFARKKCAPAEK